MGEFKSQWERAHRALGGFSNSQKLAAGLLITLIVVAGYWLTQQSASRSNMEPVLDQAFADADVVQIAQHLTDRKIPHDVRDGKVYVPADRKLEVLSELIYTDTLSGNTESGFDSLVKQSSIFDTPSKADKMFNRAREQTLQSVIGRFHSVRKATVLIDPTDERHISGASITPSALVDIQTRGNDANPRQLASAAVNTVCGAVSSMSKDRVRVTIDGASYHLGSEEFEGDVFELRQHCEQAYVAKVRQLLSYIPDVLVTVSVDVNVQSSDSEIHTVDQDRSAKIEQHAETRFDEAPSTAQDNVVLANGVPPIGDKVSDPPAPRQETKTDYAVFPGQTVEKRHTPAGKETVLSASVVVPRGYFVQLFRRGATKAVEPTDALLQPIVDAQLSKIHHLVMNALSLKNDADVTVEVYDDANAATITVAPPPSVTSISHEQAAVIPQLTTIWNHHWGWIVISGATLLMASMMLRRGAGAIAAPQGAEQSPISSPRVKVSTHVHSSRLENDSSDDDDEALLHQVRELAMARPQEAARVLREWIDQG